MFTEIVKVDFGESNAKSNSNGMKYFLSLSLLIFDLLWPKPANII